MEGYWAEKPDIALRQKYRLGPPPDPIEPSDTPWAMIDTIKQCYTYLLLSWPVPHAFSKYGQLAADLYIIKYGEDAKLQDSCP